MDKRFAIFVGLSMAIFMANVFVMRALNPPQNKPAAKAKPEKKQPDDAAKQAKPDQPADEKPADKKPADEKPAEKKPAEDAPQADPGEQPDPAKEPPANVKIAAVPDAPLEWITLGSVDPGPTNPYRMLVTLTTRGAAIERLELSRTRFLDLVDRTGYLGHLQLVPAPGGAGCLVRVVGPGTPAHEAGLQAGDVITSIAQVVVKKPAEFHSARRMTRPGQTVELKYQRSTAGQPAQQRTATVTMRRRPLAVMRPEIENIEARGETPPPDFRDPASMLLTLEQIGETTLGDDEQDELEGVDLASGTWRIDKQGPDSVTFVKPLPKWGLIVYKRYRIEPIPLDEIEDRNFPEYHLTFELEIKNDGTSGQTVAYRLDGPTGLPTEGWWYGNKVGRNWGGVGVRDMLGWWEGQGAPAQFSSSSIAEGEAEPQKSTSVMWLGVDAQYFSAILIPQKRELSDIWFNQTRAVSLSPPPTPKTIKRLTNVTCRLSSVAQTIEPGAGISHSFRLFAGPKRVPLLTGYGQPDPEGGEGFSYSLSEVVYYGWPMWAMVANVLVGVLHFFYSIFGNYGVAIILLTVLVRGSMFPLSKKQAQNMLKMQELQPEMKRIQEKYKKDMEKRSKAQRELFQKNNYNPMGGCLLMFLQLPVFMGLYRSLMVDVELRQAPLLSESIRWCSDLSAPDMLFNWTGFMPEFITKTPGFLFLGPYFNIFPIITIGLFLAQQKMFMPPAADEQAAMQQKMMKYMMIFMGVLFYKVAAGLCLYFIASTLWGITERKLLPKAKPAEDKPASKPSGESPKPAEKTAAEKPSTNGSGQPKGKKKKKKQRRR